MEDINETSQQQLTEEQKKELQKAKKREAARRREAFKRQATLENNKIIGTKKSEATKKEVENIVNEMAFKSFSESTEEQILTEFEKRRNQRLNATLNFREKQRIMDDEFLASATEEEKQKYRKARALTRSAKRARELVMLDDAELDSLYEQHMQKEAKRREKYREKQSKKNEKVM